MILLLLRLSAQLNLRRRATEVNSMHQPISLCVLIGRESHKLHYRQKVGHKALDSQAFHYSKNYYIKFMGKACLKALSMR